MINSLSGRLLILTTIFVMVAEVMIFVPSIARFREDYMLNRLERAQIASLALLADDMLDPALEEELLKNAEVFNVVLRRDEVRQLMLSSDMPQTIAATVDLRDATAMVLIRDAMRRLFRPQNEVIRVMGEPVREAGLLIEITMETAPMRMAMIDYGLRILVLSAVISVITALLLFLAMRALLLKPIKGVVGHMQRYARAPEDARRIIEPSASVTELREAEVALKMMQTDLTQALKQKERLAQLGSAVSKISHDLRNILAAAQLFTDRIETSEDPTVRRLAPKLVGSITRAVHLCESTLAFGKAEEPGPTLTMMSMAELVEDAIEAERLASRDQNLSFAVNVPAGMQLRADPEQMYRVLSNLVRNARQALMATGQEGEIGVTALEDDAAWHIDVSDTGPGLPPKAQEHLFTPFQGGARKGGSGLGLAIAAELVKGHGGSLHLVRTGQDGTCFRVTLPKGDGTL
ncbi:HAMP domain-containing histidine kinase [Sulfitobacter mediterraneus]|jgi:signal transduction histidine kinase|uniref:sensor histidine kinase n=1 Tax=Sulfitobacter TaxID=60136 RepID=UPI001931758E|nr:MULTISPECIES: HAMP domain-containing sensor histidine kinase [Sulfitobacter]MBM1633547.1 HAMP domain-containing histidine kinase [Sulfitobacter mediterraneus]MBM1641938.1 HAMP domain-containing histidine kinase [Sulfitobacter mediterraneus]MBM1645411.1 HAMP domain-containing histidine kinase [Sulfitobacter mediterraneus]MBM1650057.1 HAMP domain-containing histidine kinase [Sulfitobacter mediterraneus]MBM1653480.1 HAMP domain-containing histidine kinase [Sulfitobacter mediterraneus]